MHEPDSFVPPRVPPDVVEAILQLSDLQRRAIFYRYGEGLKMVEICERMSLTVDEVASLLRNGVLDLNRNLRSRKETTIDLTQVTQIIKDPES